MIVSAEILIQTLIERIANRKYNFVVRKKQLFPEPLF